MLSVSEASLTILSHLCHEIYTVFRIESKLSFYVSENVFGKAKTC